MSATLACSTGALGAEPPPEFETVVRADGDDTSAQERLDAKHPGFVTVLDPNDAPGVMHPDDLPSLVARAPGVATRSLGGLGQFSSLSLRGSSGQQVAIFLDGVPIDSALGDLVSLGDLPLDALGSIEIYRGYIPVRLSNRAVGGVLHLTSRGPERDTTTAMSFGYGSLDTRFATLRHQRALGEHESISLQLGYGGSQGDFSFYDHRATLGYTADDRVTERTNNDYQRLLLHARLDGKRDAWRYTLQTLLFTKDAGMPGPATAQATRGRSQTTGARLVARVERRLALPGARLQWIGGAAYEAQALVDQDPSLGRFDQRAEGGDFFNGLHLRVPLWPGALGELVADLRHERRGSRSMAVVPSTQRERTTYGAGVEIDQRLLDDAIQIVPSVRMEVNDSRFALPAGSSPLLDAGTNTVQIGVAPRVAARWTVLDAVQLRASAGRYWRPPSVLELFGQQGSLAGNPGLLPEAGTTVDGGVLVTPRGALGRVYGQVAGFATWSENLITWVPNGPRSRATNVAGALVGGLEMGISAELLPPWATLDASYTLLHSENHSEGLQGLPLPNRPQHDLTARLGSGLRSTHDFGDIIPKIFYSIDYIDNNTQDLNGRLAQPARVIHGAGGELLLRLRSAWPMDIRLAAEVRNLTDARVTNWTPPTTNDSGPVPLPVADFIGYPLPGRVFWLSLGVTTRSEEAEP